MRINLLRKNIRSWIGIAALISLLLVIGILMYWKLNQLTNGAIERQVTRQGGIAAEEIETKISDQLAQLEMLSAYVSAEDSDWQELLRTAEESYQHVSYGIMDLGGETIYGRTLSLRGHSGLQDSFHGNSAVYFYQEDGLLFSVPVFHNGNVKYVLYMLVDKEMLDDYFALSSYGDEGRAMIVTHSGEPLFDNAQGAFEGMWREETVQTAFSRVLALMTVETSAVTGIRLSKKNAYFYAADIGTTDFMYVGIVEKSAASDGLDMIGRLIIWVFGLLLLLLIAGILYLFSEEEKILESNALREAKNAAEEANRAKSDFLANMSHEIRTPINAIMGMNEMALRESTDPSVVGYMNDIRRASQNLVDIINDILDFSKIEAGKIEIVPDTYRLGELLSDVCRMISLKAGQKSLVFQVEVDKQLPSSLFGDVTRIRQIIVNLLNNAVKYTPSGSVTLRVTGEKGEDGAFVLRMQVQDTGIGIKKEDMGKLFHDFERLDMKRNRSVEGTGLGLAITAKLTELMQGEIAVESEYEKGSVFTVKLPQEIVDNTPLGDLDDSFRRQMREQGSYHALFTAPRAKILAVDDNKMNLRVVQSFLKQTKVQVTTCTGGRECLKKIAAEHFDIVLLDHMMPELDGIETLRRARQMKESPCIDTPFIALTANAIVGVRDMYLAEGFQDYLSKPIDSRQLERLLLRHLPPDVVESVWEEDVPDEAADRGGDNDKEQASEGREADRAGEQAPKMSTAPAVDAQKPSIGDGTQAGADAGDHTEGTPLIDQKLGMQYCMEDPSIYQEMLSLYVEEGTPHMEDMNRYYKAEDWDNYRILVHAIKSTSLTIGAKTVSGLAKAQEFMVKESRTEEIPQTYEDFRELYRQALAEAADILKEES